MSLSTATVTSTNLDLGPMRVTFAGTDLGATLGNVTVGIKYDLADIKADQFGSTIIEKRSAGLGITITTELAEVLKTDNWKVVFPAGNLIGSGPKSFRLLPSVGEPMTANHGSALILHPLNRSNSDLSSDYKAYFAVANGQSEVVYGPHDQARLKIVWDVYPDLATTGAPMMLFGDSTIGLINASAGGPSFTGTGNGTLTAVTVANGFTKTETITVNCIAAPSANHATFLVSGSISGVLGSCALTGGAGGTVNFSSNPINFTITDGTTDFVVNDNWTIATTAANYV